ncbi:MAG: methionine adenosyltransferase [Campylobacteraceae bacterium]|nr:methionine adenosyltransferase [Campylobacteraceae bacterium]
MYLFTSESISAGHPDKCADIIADTIVDRLLALDPNARVATEVFLSGKHIIIGGEVKTVARVGEQFYKDAALDALALIGYPEKGFEDSQTIYPTQAKIQVIVSSQSPDISMGVDQKGGEIGAGDQGMMFGYATDETEELMPAAVVYARKIRDALYAYAKVHSDKFGIDIKTQVTLDYGSKENFMQGKVKEIATIVAAIPHNSHLDIDAVRATVKSVITKTLLGDPLFDPKKVEFFIDHTGRFVMHSFIADSGLSGRKVVCDTYGGYAPVGGGSQSSKDYTKVDRSGLYAARWVAKHIVGSKLAHKALVEIAYVIGRAKPISVTIDTLGTACSSLSDEFLSLKIQEQFVLTPSWITEHFLLNKPSKDTFLYADVAAKGQVGYLEYPWEKLDALAWFQSLKH